MDATTDKNYQDMVKIIDFSISNSDICQLNTDIYNKSVAKEDSTPNFRLDFEYTENEWVTTQSLWDTTSNKWMAVFRDIIFFENEPWISDSAHFFFYDTLTSDWLINRKQISYFDGNQKETEQIGYVFNDTTQIWEKESKSTFNYDGEGHLTEEIFYFWPLADTGWVMSSKTVSTYTGDLETQEEMFIWSVFTSDWDPWFRTNYNYDGLSRMKSELDYMWDFLSEDYKLQSKDSYFYGADNSNDVDTVVNLGWDEAQNSFFINTFDVFNYEQSNSQIGSVDTYFPADNGNKSANEVQDFIKGSAIVYFYETDNTQIQDLQELEIKIYPNPSCDEVFIRILNPENCSVEIFDSNGKLLESNQIHNTSTKINISQFDSGTYFFRIENKGIRSLRKIVKL